jgi:lipopolysaccharide/colanic/teichoic acid biosynthesis glycosyltransferase
MRRLARPLMYLGTVAVVIGLGRFHAQFIGHYYFHSGQRLPWSLAYAVLLCVAAYSIGLPDLEQDRSPFWTSVAAGGLGAALISVIQLLLGSLLLPRLVVLASAAGVVPLGVICSRLAVAGRGRDAGRDRVVAVVGAEEAETLAAELGRAPERSAALVACLSPGEAMSTGPTSRPLIEAVIAAKATIIVLDRMAQTDESTVAQAAVLHENGLRIRTLSVFYDEWLGKLPLAELERVSLMFDIGELHRARYGRVKRLADIVLGLAGLIILVPVTVAVALGDLVANRGPLMYRQDRVGKNGHVFDMLKFRTMRPGFASSEWTSTHDARVTPFGRWLRGTHLDELPQVVNVLRGDLSIVGPRPEQPKYVAELRQQIPFYDLRQRVRPGLTGWAQVKYRYASSEMDAMEKLQYEFYYLRHQDLTLDLRIVARTLRSVFGRDGR